MLQIPHDGDTAAGKATMTDSPHLLSERAAQLERTGRLADAERAYEHLLAQWPDLPNCWYNLARLQRMAGRYDAALASYGHALERGARAPEEIHLNRGVIYADDLRQDDLAERELTAALIINPSYVPALLNLANLDEDRGRKEEALALYQRILAIEPVNSTALARYAGLATATGPDDPLIDRIKRAIAAPGTAPSGKASLAFALGHVLDGCGAYEQAFEAFVAANRFSRESTGVRGPLYDRKKHERLIDQVIETFTAARCAGPTPSGIVPPIFICGMFRSGSTLVEQVLAAHPLVQAGGELGELPALVKSELTPFPAAVAQASPGVLGSIRTRYLDAIAAKFPLHQRVTDKRLENFLYLGLIRALFANARIIHTTRNPLDNCLSIFFLHLDQSMGYALDLMDTAHYYRQYRRLMAHWKSLFGEQILDFHYDAFVQDPRPAVERLLHFCGLPWDDACLEFHGIQSTVKTASVWQVRQPLYRKSSGRWRSYESSLGPLKTYLRDLT